ncbi:phage head closure protein [Pseudomonas syringae]
MRAGRLRHRITIQRPHYDQDPVTGEMVTSWVDAWAKVPAAVEPVSVTQFVVAAAPQNRVSVRIIIRYRAGVEPAMRILYRQKVYDIQGVLADTDSGLDYLTLPCSEGVTDG